LRRSGSASADACKPGRSGDAREREVQQRVQLGAAERRALGRPLHLDELAVTGRHDVHVGAGAHVLGVVEVQHGTAVDDAHADGGDAAHQRLRRARLRAGVGEARRTPR
jgi:hypothetical protein